MVARNFPKRYFEYTRGKCWVGYFPLPFFPLSEKLLERPKREGEEKNTLCGRGVYCTCSNFIWIWVQILLSVFLTSMKVSRKVIGKYSFSTLNEMSLPAHAYLAVGILMKPFAFKAEVTRQQLRRPGTTAWKQQLLHGRNGSCGGAASKWDSSACKLLLAVSMDFLLLLLRTKASFVSSFELKRERSTRPAFSQLKTRRATFLNYTKFADFLILMLYNWDRAGRAGTNSLLVQKRKKGTTAWPNVGKRRESRKSIPWSRNVLKKPPCLTRN